MKPITVMVVPADKDAEITLAHFTDTYEELKKTIGGWIEELPQGNPFVTLWGDEEARIKDLPSNVRINKLLGPGAEEYKDTGGSVVALDDNFQPIEETRQSLRTGDNIFPAVGYALGTVVITGASDDEGYSTSLTRKQVRNLRETLQRVGEELGDS